MNEIMRQDPYITSDTLYQCIKDPDSFLPLYIDDYFTYEENAQQKSFKDLIMAQMKARGLKV